MSTTLQHAMKKHNTTIQLVPPHSHCANIVERAIQTFKAHFKAGQSSFHPDFLTNDCDRLLPQAFMTLNMLQKSGMDPQYQYTLISLEHLISIALL